MAVLGLGLAALGRPGYSTLGHAGDFPSTDPADMERQAHAVLDCAYANGIRHIDTARSYGRGEQFLASWLQKRKPQDVFVSSKWGYRYTADWQRTAAVHEVKEHSLEHFEQQWAESKAILGPWLKLYQIHSATFESEVLDDSDILLRLFRLRKETGVKIGATVTGVKQPALLHRIYMLISGEEEDQIFDWVQATWNVLLQHAGGALLAAHSNSANVIIKEALAGGRLSSRGNHARWLEMAADLRVTPDALALGIALEQPFADVVLSGAATVAQLESNLKAREVKAGSLPWRELEEDPEVYWATRAKLPWT